jgi:hypothetical protein
LLLQLWQLRLEWPLVLFPQFLLLKLLLLLLNLLLLGPAQCP